MATIIKHILSDCIVAEADEDFDTGIPELIREYVAAHSKEAHPAIIGLYGGESAPLKSEPYRRSIKKRRRPGNDKFTRSPWGSREIVNGKLRCSHCHKMRPLESFSIKRSNRLGYDYNCRSCKSELRAKRRELQKKLKK